MKIDNTNSPSNSIRKNKDIKEKRKKEVIQAQPFVPLRYKPPAQGTPGAPGEDPTTDYMNVLGMIFSMCGLMMRVSANTTFQTKQ